MNASFPFSIFCGLYFCIIFLLLVGLNRPSKIEKDVEILKVQMRILIMELKKDK